ncbi:copper resistance system multicopper oxidase [Dasania sp. GY-MA-18]|uniref:Copper resistance system multicopper oxidase n=1 Tax=Dasania phycosphaerae TaxID=2950436 RepID=A0A9J6RNS8_9GAMM|nr:MULTISPECIES: copper resistance system multicopper oxidase [Dasania]MCR8923560.1 copper resistance system multicopper oxidase [Dasania sp. GY-MA-18]MCZ0865994.1 copper resistance system multicopper oxidase [Dasania phycosphaerae]MCZ0869718.1 copper resistance system multicopper oxidase [Dasania phycosphaerae]
MSKQTTDIQLLTSPLMTRRHFVSGMAAGSALLGLGLGLGLEVNAGSVNASVLPRTGPSTLRGKQFDLTIGYQDVNFTGTPRVATTVNGSLPAPVLRWREGDRVTLRVKNNLSVDTSIHWHGMILPTEMDGVPGLSFGGIKPGEIFEYQFDVKQSGTYWYHSHSGFQEPTGLYGAIIIDPKLPDPVSYDREHVVVLSDWSDESPHDIYAKLKKLSHYYNFRERTAIDLWRDIKEKGLAQTWNERAMWNQMRMSETDIADVTGYTYIHLMNGVTPAEGWVGLFKRGEKVRLRFINASSMTIFDLRIPGLTMTVVAADGQNVQPVSVDEFRIGVAETYDVIVEPSAARAYTVFAQSIDRSGYARGTLTPDVGLTAAVPAMDEAPVLGHGDMGMAMNHGDHSMHGMDHSQHAMADMRGMDHSQHGMFAMKGMDHSQHGIVETPTQSETQKLGKAGLGSTREITHVASELGPHVDMRAEAPQSGLNDPGLGLRNHQQLHGRRVLTYADLKNLTPTLEKREPSREIELHLTGNMSRYMWSMNGIKFADAEPLQLKYGERVRITLVNDTMMTHPMHLHGLWSELETGDPDYIPRKHTVLVQPGAKISYLVSADAIGRWAYHCHLVYHMPGMFREVRVS